MTNDNPSSSESRPGAGNAHLLLADQIRSGGPLSAVPSVNELTEHLRLRQAEVGGVAWAEFAYLQKIAAEVWGPEKTAHFARILRDARVKGKAKDGCRWERAVIMLSRLPEEWQAPLREHISISKKGKAVLGRTIWSVSYAQSVISALTRWHIYCTEMGIPLTPTGGSLHRYATDLTSRIADRAPVSDRTAADYLQRIMSGLGIVAQRWFVSSACDYVVTDWSERAKSQDSHTKSGAQLVGASRIYTFGFELMQKARSRKMRGLHAAKDFRNGLLLAVAVALPERARALSTLEFDTNLWLVGKESIRIVLPGSALKLPEAQKHMTSVTFILENPSLAAALIEYRTTYRPLFDDGSCLFPSVHGKTGPVTERHLGRLAGDLLEAEFVTRVSLHRIRDNVATEASEVLHDGGRSATVLLRHRDRAVTQRHYDHSEGILAAVQFGRSIDARRTKQPELAF